jgi:hypothetical protein
MRREAGAACEVLAKAAVAHPQFPRGATQVGDKSLVLINGSGRTEETPPTEEDAWGSLWKGALSSLLDWMDGGPEPMLGTQNVPRTCELNLAAYLSRLLAD